jgi:lipopolysaccharide/colanic/teichoic acid biosynthesis glycosyltransferase
MTAEPQEFDLKTSQTYPTMPSGQASKRLVDMVLSAAALIGLSPFLLLIALAIRLDGGTPALYRQKRYGQGQREFTILKFRTLSVADSDDVFRQVRDSSDEQVTRVGRFLRAWNLDELPQLWNVLKGDMSLVGPRPHPVRMDQHYQHRLPLYTRRFDAKPGLTGWAQVNGHRGPTPTLGSMQARLEHDLFYIENRSLRFDLKIMVLTVFSANAFRNAF